MINKKRPGTTDDQSPEYMLNANGQSTVSPVEKMRRCVRGVCAARACGVWYVACA